MINKIFILLIVLFMLPSCSLISFTNSNEKNEEKQREIELKNTEELNRKQELEKESRLKELISLYDKGLSKDILRENMDDFDLYIEDIRKIDNEKAADIDILLCNELNHFDGCFRTVEYYVKIKDSKKADEVFDKLLSACIFGGYSKACSHVNKVLVISILNNGKYTLYDNMFLKSNVIFDKNSGSVKLEFIDGINKVSMPFIIENGYNHSSVTCMTAFESALNAKDKLEEYYTDKCQLYPSFDGKGIFYNHGFDYMGAIKANKDYIYIEVPDFFVNTGVGGLSYNGYTIKIPQKIAKEIYDNFSTLLKKNVKVEPTNYFKKQD